MVKIQVNLERVAHHYSLSASGASKDTPLVPGLEEHNWRGRALGRGQLECLHENGGIVLHVQVNGTSRRVTGAVEPTCLVT